MPGPGRASSANPSRRPLRLTGRRCTFRFLHTQWKLSTKSGRHNVTESRAVFETSCLRPKNARKRLLWPPRWTCLTDFRSLHPADILPTFTLLFDPPRWIPPLIICVNGNGVAPVLNCMLPGHYSKITLPSRWRNHQAYHLRETAD